MEDNQLKISEMPELKTPSLIDKELEPSFPVILKGQDGNYYNYATSTRLFAEYILDEIKNSGYVTLDKLMAKLKELNLGKYLTEADVKKLLDELNLDKYMTKVDLKFELEVIYQKLYTLLENYLGAPNYDIIKAYRTSDSYVNNFGTSYKNDENYPPQGWSLGLTQDATAGQYVWECQARKTNDGYYTWLDGSIWSTAICVGKIGGSSSSTGASPGTNPGGSDIPAYSGVTIQYIYKEADTKPETPKRTEGYYNFETKTLTPPKSWSLTYSDTAKTHIWYTSKMFYENTAFGDVEWTPVALLIRNAGDLLDSVENVISANVVVYTESETKPTKPTGGEYNFQTKELVECPRDPNNSVLWKKSPEDFKSIAWVSYNNFHSNGESTGWTDPVKTVNLGAVLEATKEQAESIASQAVSNATSDINKALEDLEKSGENFVAVVNSLDVLYEWLENEAPGESDTIIEESPIATLEELKTKSGADYFKKFCKVGDQWYRYTATAGSLTTQLSNLETEYDDLDKRVATNTSVIQQMPNEIRLQVAKGYTDTVTWSQLEQSDFESQIIKIATKESGTSQKQEVINALQEIDTKGVDKINNLLSGTKVEVIVPTNCHTLEDLIATYTDIKDIKFGSYYILKNPSSTNLYFRADYPLSTSFMDMLASSLKLGVANTEGKEAIFELSITNGVSNTLISSDQIVLNGDVLAKALYSKALTIIDEEDGITPVTILNGDGSVMFGKNSVSFDKSGLGYVAGGLISWDHFKYDSNGEIVYNNQGEPVIDSSKPINLHIKGIISAYAGQIGGWTLAGDANSLDSSTKPHTTLDQAYLYSKRIIDGVETKLVLSPQKIHCGTTATEDMYALNSDGSARFAKGFVRFEKDGSGGIHPGTGDYEKNAENGLTWNANGDFKIGANVNLTWNNKNTTLGQALSEAASSGGNVNGLTESQVVDIIHNTSIDSSQISAPIVSGTFGKFYGDVMARSFSVLHSDTKNDKVNSKPVFSMTTLGNIKSNVTSEVISKAGLTGASDETPILLVSEWDSTTGALVNQYIVNLTKMTNTGSISFDTDEYKYFGKYTKGLSVNNILDADTILYKYIDKNNTKPEWNNRYFTKAPDASITSLYLAEGQYFKCLKTDGYVWSFGGENYGMYVPSGIKVYGVYNFNKGVPTLTALFTLVKPAENNNGTWKPATVYQIGLPLETLWTPKEVYINSNTGASYNFNIAVKNIKLGYSSLPELADLPKPETFRVFKQNANQYNVIYFTPNYVNYNFEVN